MTERETVAADLGAEDRPLPRKLQADREQNKRLQGCGRGLGHAIKILFDYFNVILVLGFDKLRLTMI